MYENVLKADSYKKHEGPPVYFEALAEDGSVLGWCVEMVSRGYGGKIYFLVSLYSWDSLYFCRECVVLLGTQVKFCVFPYFCSFY